MEYPVTEQVLVAFAFGDEPLPGLRALADKVKLLEAKARCWDATTYLKLQQSGLGTEWPDRHGRD